MRSFAYKLVIMGAALGLLSFVCVAQTTSSPGAESDPATREFLEATKVYSAASTMSNSTDWATTALKFRDALERFDRARELFRKSGNRQKEAACLAWIGRLYSYLSDRKRSVESYNAAISIFSELGDRLEVGNQKANLGLLFFGAKDYNTAIKYYNEALAEARATKNTSLESLALSVLGQCYSALFDRPTAIKYWEQALKVAETSGDTSKQAWELNLLAGAYADAGEREKAIDAYTKALNIYSKQPQNNTSRTLAANTMVNIASLVGELGNHRQALEIEKGALLLYRLTNARFAEAATLRRLGISYSNVGEPENALKYLEDALTAYKAIGERSGEAAALEKISYVYLYNLDNPGKALTYAERSLSLARELRNVPSEAAALVSLGNIYSYMPDGNKRSIEYTNQALELYRSAKDIEKVGDTLYKLGIKYFLQDEYRAAIEHFDEALITYADFGIVMSLPETLHWLQSSWSMAGNPKLATAYGKQAVFSFQRLRRNIKRVDEASQRGYLRSVERNYRALIRELLDQDRRLEAHQILTMFKDEQSLDMYETADQRPVMAPAFTPNEARFWKDYIGVFQEIRVAREAAAILTQKTADRQPTEEEAAELRRLETERANARKKLADLLRSAPLEFGKPATENDVVAQLPQSTAIWNAVTELSAQTRQRTVVIYQIVDDTNIYFMIFSSADMRHVSVRVEGINDKARKLWALLQSDKFDPRPLGKELYDVVFKPIEKDLPADTKTILWSLDGNLRYIPMGALFDGKQYLVERYNHVTFTRADGDRLTSAISPSWSAAAFGSTKPHTVENLAEKVSFSALPGVANEIDTLFAKNRKPVLRGDVLLDQTFTREAMLRKLAAKPPVVHIASHFSFRPGDESRSFLLLGDGTPFTLADMKKHKDLFAGVELLTLSACNTAAQQPDANGREVDAFFELAQRLGARSVLATLWPVADNSTPWLMREFYDLKINRKQNKAEALRNAQLALLNGSAKASRSRTRSDASQVKIVVADDTSKPADTRGESFVIEKKDAKPYRTDPKRPFAHPFYWSPFVLIGNWR